MDDFTLVLGMKFLRQFNAVPFLRYNSMCILEGALCLVPKVSTTIPPGQLFVMQINKGCKQHDGKDVMAMEPIPEAIAQVLEEYKDVMSPELPK